MAHLGVKAGVGAVGVNRIVPGDVGVIPAAAHLHHVPRVAHRVAGHKDAGHARTREQQLVGQRVALAHGRAAYQGTVCGEGCRGRGRAGRRAVVDAVANQVVVQGLGHLEVGHVVGVDPGQGLGDLGLGGRFDRGDIGSVDHVVERQAGGRVGVAGRAVAVGVVVAKGVAGRGPVVLGVGEGLGHRGAGIGHGDAVGSSEGHAGGAGRPGGKDLLLGRGGLGREGLAVGGEKLDGVRPGLEREVVVGVEVDGGEKGVGGGGRGGLVGRGARIGFVGRGARVGRVGLVARLANNCGGRIYLRVIDPQLIGQRRGRARGDDHGQRGGDRNERVRRFLHCRFPVFGRPASSEL